MDKIRFTKHQTWSVAISKWAPYFQDAPWWIRGLGRHLHPHSLCESIMNQGGQIAWHDLILFEIWLDIRENTSNRIRHILASRGDEGIQNVMGDA